MTLPEIFDPQWLRGDYESVSNRRQNPTGKVEDITMAVLDGPAGVQSTPPELRWALPASASPARCSCRASSNFRRRALRRQPTGAAALGCVRAETPGLRL
jgi:hypothetical protein